MRIAITGSNGFIGNELVQYLASKGNEVLMLQRRPPEQILKGVSYVHYDLDDPKMLPEPGMIDALIHCAYIPFIKGNRSSQKNLEGTLKLYNNCAANGIQFVFLSSMSAHADARSEYGKSKWAIENSLDKSKCLILKLGLVMGKKGLFHRIYSTVQKTSFAFMIGGGGQPIQPVYIGDVARIIEKCIREKITGSYNIATPQVYSMKELFQAIANQQGKKLVFIPVPYFLAAAAIRMIELLHLPFPVSKENLYGLKQLRSFNTHDDIQKTGIELTSMEEAIRQLS